MYVPVIPRKSSELFMFAVALVLILFSITIQFSWFPVVTSDYTYFVAKWFSMLQSSSGLTAFAEPFSDYAPLYLYILKFLTFVPVDSLTSIKAVSLIADGASAFCIIFIARNSSPRRFSGAQLAVIFVIFLCIPTIALNGSLWGQTDILYALPTIATFYFLLRYQPILASTLFGIALSVKVQAIFFAPVFIGYMLQRKSTRGFIVIPFIVFVLSVIPVIFGGGDFWYWLFIYAKEAGEYPYLSVSAPSVFAFASNAALSTSLQNLLFWAGIGTAALCASIVCYIVATDREKTAEKLALLSLISVLIIPYVLPRMHERYFFLADIFSFMYALFNPSEWYIAGMVILASTLSYMPFLSSQVAFLSFAHIDLRIPALFLFAALCILFLKLIRLNTENST